jgi:hypothetical protein
LEEGEERGETLRVGQLVARFEVGAIILLHPFIICMFISLQFHLFDPFDPLRKIQPGSTQREFCFL